jgi:hypothetical protein
MEEKMRARSASLLALWLLAGCPGTLEDPTRFLDIDSSGGVSSGGEGSGSSSSSSGSSGSASSNGSTGGTSSSSYRSDGGSSSGSSSGASSTNSAPPACDAPTQVFSTICAQCHGPAPLNLGALDLISADVTARLVDVTPPLCETTASGAPQFYVVAGHPGDSYLYDKVSSAHPVCGNRMPQNLALSAADQQCVYDWIYNLDGGG